MQTEMRLVVKPISFELGATNEYDSTYSDVRVPSRRRDVNNKNNNKTGYSCLFFAMKIQ